MSSIVGVWRLQSFVVNKGGGRIEKPFGDHPVGILVFSRPEAGEPYMGAQLTSRPGGDAPDDAPTFSFSATFEAGETSYRFTPTASNDAKKFPVGKTTPPKAYRLLSQGEIFEESWQEDDGSSVQVSWQRLHDQGR